MDKHSYVYSYPPREQPLQVPNSFDYRFFMIDLGWVVRIECRTICKNEVFACYKDVTENQKIECGRSWADLKNSAVRFCAFKMYSHNHKLEKGHVPPFIPKSINQLEIVDDDISS